MVPEPNIPAIGLTIFLLKEGYNSENSLKQQSYNLEQHSIGSPARQIGELFVQLRTPKPPRWASFFEGYLSPGQLGQGASTGAVLITEAQERHFALTFGQGRHLLIPECWEERFGLRVALNSIGEGKIRSIDKKKFDAISLHSREQASREARPVDFGLDIEQDLLRAVAGTPDDATLGIRLSGMDALHANVQTDIDGIRYLLSRYYNKYLDQSYRKNFPWVDQISEIKSPSVVERLDQILIEQIAANEHDKIWMAVPEIVSWEFIAGFRFGLGSKSPIFYDINLLNFLASLREPETLSITKIKQRPVYSVNNDGDKISSWTAYRCLYAEIEEENDYYLLNGGKWYKITNNFVQEIKKAYRNLPRYPNQLPMYNDDSETAYNERIANDNQDTFALMDNKTIMYGGGYNRIEFCDLFTKEKDIIHVKRYCESSSLSHLFAQGLISGVLFHTEANFRQEVNNLLPSSHRFDSPTQRVNPSDYRIVYAIISEAEGDLVIPFFSMINLKHAVRNLNGYGYQVAILKIDVDEHKSKLSRMV